LCFDNTDCTASGGTCRTDANVCLTDANNPNVCAGWCISLCADVVTAAFDASGNCFVFADSCIPPGFKAAGGSACPVPVP
jgi:hypothetical protein